MRRALVVLGALVAVLLAALFALPHVIDWDRYRGSFEEEASRLLGREVRVGGRVNLRLLPTPYLHFEKIRVADVAGPVGEPLFRAESLTVWLALSPLLGGSLEASEVEVTRPVLNLVLDRNGSGNWAGLVDAKRPAAFVPKEVALRSVSLKDGTLAVHGPDGSLRTSIDGITGTLSATALEGPYKVQVEFLAGRSGSGAAERGRRPHELRLSTSRADGEGAVRIKASVRAPDTGASYTLDATARDPLGVIRLTGALAAHIPVAPAGSRKKPAMLEIKANVIADTAALEMKDLALSFEANDGRPQLATGGARISWRDSTTAEVLLDSRWLDLDRILGSDADAAPHELIAHVASLIDAGLPPTAETRAFMLLDQATLGGEIVSGLRLGIDRAGDTLKLSELSAHLPGGTRLTASGVVRPRGAAGASFDGMVSVRGVSLARFLGWADRRRALPELKRDGPFALSGRIAAGPQSVSGRGLRVEVARNSLGGDAEWTGGSAPHVMLDLEGGALDLSAFMDHEPVVSDLLRSVWGRFAGSPASAPAAAPGGPPGIRADVRLRLGRLVTAAQTYSDVQVRVNWSPDLLSVSRLRLKGATGWQVDLQGQLPAHPTATSTGALTGLVESTSGAGLRDLLAMAGAPAASMPSDRRIDALAPARLAMRLDLGAKGKPASGASRITVDGMLGASRLVATLALGDRAASWRSQDLDFDARVDAPEVSTLLAQILPDGLVPVTGGATRVPGRLVVKAAGTPGNGLSTLAALDSAGLNAELGGAVRIDDTGVPHFDGTSRVAAEDLGYVLSLSSLGHRKGLDGTAIRGDLRTTYDKGRLRLETGDLQLGGSRLAGTLDVQMDRAPIRADATLQATKVEIGKALAMLLDERGLAPAPAGARAKARHLWPDAPFDLSAIDGWEGHLRLTTPRLELDDRMGLDAVALEAKTRAGTFELTVGAGQAFGGKATGNVMLSRTPAGVALAGDMRLQGGHLAAGEGDGQPFPLTAGLDLELSLKGQALSPRGLVGQLSGRGSVTLSNATINGLAPASVKTVSEAFVRRSPAPPAGELERLLGDALREGHVKVGGRRLALTLTDGAVRVEPLSATDDQGRVVASTTVDMESLGIDSEWRIEGIAAAAPRGISTSGRTQYPPISVVWAGPLGGAAAPRPQLQLGALERELGVRRMEFEVEQLERLRREDEERVRKERERQRALEAERQRQREAEAQRFEAERARAAQQAPGASPVAAPPTLTPSPAPQAAPGAATPAQPAQPADPATRAGPTGAVPASQPQQGTEPAAAGAPAPEPHRAVPVPRPAVRPPRPPSGYRPLNPNEILRNLGQ